MGRRAGELERAGRFDEAEAVLRELLRLQPANPAGRYALAILLLRRGAFPEGWTHYEARTELRELGIAKPTLPFPEWGGEPVKSLLVIPEQGMGDVIQFARYVPELVARGIHVTLGAWPPLVRLLSRLGAEVVPWAGKITVFAHDAWVLVGSLPLHLQTIPSAPYLPSRVEGRGVGVVVKGNPKHTNDARRSLFGSDAEALLTMGQDLSPEATGAQDFEDTAQIIHNLEAVVTVDTSVAHLAGAMGKRTILLLPHLADWRWGVSGERSIWYPSMRLLRQTSPGEWSSVIQKAREAALPQGR